MITVTVDPDAFARAAYKKLGHERYMDLLEQHEGCVEQFSQVAFPSIVSFRQNPDPADPDYVGSYTFEFGSDDDAVYFRMTS